MKPLNAVLLGATLVAPALFADTKVKLADLPAAVQKSVREQTNAATLVGLSKEVENGKTMYEVETIVNGKTRDLVLDSKGSLIETEDEVDIAAIPLAAKNAIQKLAAGGTVKKVEKLTVGSSVSYEAALKSKSGKSIAVSVNADGSPHKD